MTCKDKNLENYPGFTCVGDNSYEGCWQHFGKVESFDSHFVILDDSQPMWPPDEWTDEQAKEHEQKFPQGNLRCATPAEIEAMGLSLDDRLVWRTPGEEVVKNRLQDALTKHRIKNQDDDVLDD